MKPRFRWLVLLAIFVLLSRLPGEALLEARPFEDIDEVGDALLALSEHIASAPGQQADHYLAKVGFAPNMSAQIAGWDGFSPARKIETAYLKAMEISPQNGSRFLAMLSRAISEDYPAVARDLHIRRWAELEIGRESKVQYATQGPNLPDFLHLSPEIRRPIATLASYVQQGSALPVNELLESIGMPERQVYELLRSNGDVGRILQTAVRQAGTAQSVAMTHELLRKVHEVSPTVLMAPGVKVFLEKHGDPPTTPVKLRFPTEPDRDPDLGVGDHEEAQKSGPAGGSGQLSVGLAAA